MFSTIGKVIAAVAGLGGHWLENKGKIADAKAALELAELQVRAANKASEFEIELEQLKQTSALDLVTKKQAEKSYMDELLTVGAFGLLGIVLYGAVAGLSPDQWGKVLLDTLNSLPWWLQLIIILIYVNYFSFRSLLRWAIKAFLAYMTRSRPPPDPEIQAPRSEPAPSERLNVVSPPRSQTSDR